MQQSLPFTVLKPCNTLNLLLAGSVATVLTVYGIETRKLKLPTTVLVSLVATVLTVYGIETQIHIIIYIIFKICVATVLTVYGIETASLRRTASIFSSLQQSLPFTVLKLNFNVISLRSNSNRCNSPYRLRY